jgi:His/Glu/Gln/Arg/opine family amino acid ABC transporter permease subunit
MSFVLAASSYTFDWSVVWDNQGVLLRALKITFEISIVAEILSLVVGLLIAILRVQKARPLQWLAIGFIDFFRAVPLLVLLIWLYYGVTIITGLSFSAFQAGVIGIGLLYGANLAEIFRAGLEAVPVGQREAALTLGLSRRQALQSVVLPQAVRISIPPLGNMWIGVLKDSTLVSILGIQEIMRTAQNVVLENFRPFEIYTTVAVIYLILVFIFSRLIAVLERRMPLR